MNTPAKLVALLLLLTLNPQLSTVFAQGSLTPPGAPAPTMKTLDQIEARTPISQLPFAINTGGSYYLTGNLSTGASNAIVIAASGVTLDLSGFTISSMVANAANGGTGILLVSGLSDISILNGHILGGVTNNGSGVYSGSGFGSGIFYSGIALVNTRVSSVSVAGCLHYGIFLSGNSTVVEACMVRTVGNLGIFASTISGSVAVDCGGYAIFGIQVSDCRGEGAGTGYGVYANNALNCYGSSTLVGLYADNTAQSCYGFSSGDTGLYANNTALNCYGASSSGIGVNAAIAQNCYGASSSATGLNAGAAQNCQGYSTSGGPGISAETASNCYGQGLIRGISANVAISCSGRSLGGSYGVFATSIANTCYGISATGTGLGANIAIGCIGVNNSGPSVLASFKYNMPP